VRHHRARSRSEHHEEEQLMGFFTGSQRRNVARSSAKATVARHVESHQPTMAGPSNGTTGNTPHCQIPLSFQIMKWRRLPHRPPPPASREVPGIQRALLSTACAFRCVREAGPTQTSYIRFDAASSAPRAVPAGRQPEPHVGPFGLR